MLTFCTHSPSVDPPYPVYGGIFREEAIMLLRRFYVQENDKGMLVRMSEVYCKLTFPKHQNHTRKARES